MPRAISILMGYALFLCILVDGPWAVPLILILLIYSLTLGICGLVVMKELRLGSWWQSLIVGAVISLPLGLLTNAGSQIYTFVFFMAFGMAGGLIVWMLGIFRNPSFTLPNQKFPLSLVLTPFGAIPLFFYLQALESKWVYGCITDFQLSAKPIPENHAVITVVIDDGPQYQTGIKEGFSDPEIIGNCAMGKLEPKASLKGSDYVLISTESNNCNQICPNQN